MEISTWELHCEHFIVGKNVDSLGLAILAVFFLIFLQIDVIARTPAFDNLGGGAARRLSQRNTIVFEILVFCAL